MTEAEFIRQSAIVTLQVFFTLAILSFLYRDNPVYRFAEHLFVGVAAGYWIVIQFHTIFLPHFWVPIKEQALIPLITLEFSAIDYSSLLLLIPGGLGFMMFLKFHRKTAWITRWPMAVVIGTYAGLAIIGFAQGDLMPQIRANFLPIIEKDAISNFLAAPSLAHLFRLLWNPILIVGVITSLVYFFFSMEHKGVTGATATVGIWFLMISFGASYGNTVMTRISLFLERADFLLENPWTTVISAVGIVIAITLYFTVGPSKKRVVRQNYNGPQNSDHPMKWIGRS